MGKKSPPLYLCEKWSEAKFRQTLKSALRASTQHWPPIAERLKMVERKVETGELFKNGRKKYKTQHQCEQCLNWFDKVRNKRGNLKPGVEVDHIVAIGGFSDDITKWNEDLARMYKNAFCTVDQLQCLCFDCHKTKTLEERK